MKTLFCHYCPLCGNLNTGPRTPNSSCTSCLQSTYIQCPECNEPLLGKQFRCPHCLKQISWLNKKPISISQKGLRHKADYSIQSLEPKFAKKLATDNKKQNEPVLVVRKLSHLGGDVLSELSAFNGELHLPDVKTLQDIGTSVTFKPDLTFLYLDGLQNISPERHAAFLDISAPLSLCGLRMISPELALVIQKRRFPTVLNGISHLDQSSAELLTTTQGKLRLDNLSVEDCPIELQGRFFTEELSSFSDALVELSPTLARSMRENLSKDKLSLNGVKRLSATSANELIGDHNLHLDGLTELNQEVAEELGRHKGSLMLDGIATTNAEIFQSLTKHPKRLSLRSLKSLPFDGLRNLERRSNVILRLFSLKKLTAKKSHQLARLPIHIELDSGAALSIETVEILKDGDARFTIKNPESIDPAVMKRIADVDVRNIFIDTTTELQRKISYQKQRLIKNLTIKLDLQKTFSIQDLEAINAFPERLKIIFKETVPVDLETASLVSQCNADFVFLNTESLTNRVLSKLLIHRNSIVLCAFETNTQQCGIICKEKNVGSLQIPLYFNTDLTPDQINILRENKRIKLD